MRTKIGRLIVIAKCISLSLADSLFLPTKTKLTWINGIGFNLDHMQDGQQSLSYIFGRPISYYHNPTAMASEEDKFGYLNDLAQAGQQKLGRITSEVDELHIHLKDAIQSVGPKGRVIHIAHSQGALITSLAVKRLTKMEMSQLEIICFGGAEALRVTPDFPFARCVNYYSVNDPLLFLVPQAARALRTGFMGTECSGEALAKMAANTEPEFVFLSPRAGDPILDHGLFGPTYLDALKWEGRRYRTLYLPAWYNAMMIAFAYGETMSTGVAEACIHVIMYILEQTLLRFIRFVQYVNGIIYQEIILPIAQVLFILYIKLKELIRKVSFEVHCNVGKGNQTIKWLASLAGVRLKTDAPKRSIPPNLFPFPKALYTGRLSFVHPEARINNLLSDGECVYIEFYHENLQVDTMGIPILSNWSFIAYCNSSRKAETRMKLITDFENQSKRSDEARIRKAEEDLISKNKPRIRKMRDLLSGQLVDGSGVAIIMEDLWIKMTLSGTLDSLVKAEAERDSIRSFFITHYLDFSEMFKTFSGVNAQGSTSTLEYVEFNKFIYETGIFSSGQHSNMILKLFGDVNTTIHSELDQCDFFLSLVQIAIYRYITLSKRELIAREKKGQQFSRGEMIPSPSKALELLYNEHLKPLLERSDVKDFLRSDDGLLLLFEYLDILCKMFCNYANLPYDPNYRDDCVKAGVLTLKQFNQFASDDFLGISVSGKNNITLKDARQIFSVSQNDGILIEMEDIDFANRDSSDDHQLKMDFPEFIEGVCRLCVLKHDVYDEHIKSVEHYLKKKRDRS